MAELEGEEVAVGGYEGCSLLWREQKDMDRQREDGRRLSDGQAAGRNASSKTLPPQSPEQATSPPVSLMQNSRSQHCQPPEDSKYRPLKTAGSGGPGNRAALLCLTGCTSDVRSPHQDY